MKMKIEDTYSMDEIVSKEERIRDISSVSSVKQRKYKITDEEYFWALGEVCDNFDENGIDNVLVGGVATQLYVASLICGENTNLNESGVEKILRSTDDYDICTSNGNHGQTRAVLNSLSYEVETEDNIYQISLERDGAKKPILNVDSATAPEGGHRIMLNISYDGSDHRVLAPCHYEDTVATGRKVELAMNDNLKISVNIARPEYIIASKLTRFNDRDKYDIELILDTAERCGESIDFDLIKKILGRENEELFSNLDQAA